MQIYKAIDGTYITESELKTAFIVINGSKASNDGKYTTFVDYFNGKTFFPSPDTTPEDILRNGQKVLAVKLYREINKCSLKEAHDAIDAIILEGK